MVGSKKLVSGVLGVAVEMFLQVPSLLGWQFVHGFPVFTQTQPLHKPDLLHLQHAIALQLLHSSFAFCSLVVNGVTGHGLPQDRSSGGGGGPSLGYFLPPEFLS